MLVLKIIFPIVIIFLLSTLFLLSGMGLYNKSVNSSYAQPISFRIGFSFFLGMALFLSSWIILETIIGSADYSLYFSVLFKIIICYILRNEYDFKKWNKSIKPFLKYLFFIGGFVPFILLIFYLPPFEKGTTWIGSTNSLSYSNISIYFFQSNSIPGFSNNIGQSLLASIPLFLGFPSTSLLNNFIWLSFCNLAFGITLFGFFRLFNLSYTKSWIGLFLVMFGNTALSLFYVNVIDSGNPYFLISYSHTYFAVGSFLGSLIWARNILLENNRSFFYISLIIISFVISWCITAPQNIVIGFPMILIMGFFGTIKKKINYKIFTKFFLIALFALPIGIINGGMLSPKKFRNPPDLYGLGKTPVGKIIIPNLGLESGGTGIYHNYLTTFPPWERFKNVREQYKKIFKYDKNLKKVFFEFQQGSGRIFLEILVRFQTEFWLAIRLMFFPLLGIFLLNILLIKNNKNQYLLIQKFSNEQTALLTYLKNSANLSFLGGFILAFFLEIEGHKWELNKMLNPGILLGMISLFLAINFLIINAERFQLNFVKIIFFSTIIISIIPPILYILINLILNIFDFNSNGENIIERAKLMIEVSNILDIRTPNEIKGILNL